MTSYEDEPMKSWWIALGCMVALGVAQAQDAPADGGKGGGSHEACKPDVEKFCSGVEPGGGRIMSCMRKHKDELSQACKDSIHGHKGPPPAADQPPKQ
jgi:Cysteine rich repeat